MPNAFILLAEDSEDDEKLTLRALRDLPSCYSVRVARDGGAAAEMLGLRGGANSNAPLPILVLLDIQMPKINGLDLLQMIRDEGRTNLLNVVVFSSSNRKEDVDRAHGLRAEYRQKPMEYSEYLDTVKSVVSQALPSFHPEASALSMARLA
ncbi:response regulator [Fimbriimonas ginsengisoli]|uniref:Response regulator receiver domain-containing protein n=1 Tax=Fimbriimonas ginsengisoli Gsoil 348 TaxID=661478 RepID=A0A068NQW7_FIMGI|nr:response regulator [Fimbriimonas ginsengisoli]AIE85836.1 response regulator receiver domain-containing protein [Fimbriimonas ginsengisoli Gsoil 348]